MPTIDLKDKFQGCILGSAIGDALGYTVEFSSMAEIQKRFKGPIKTLQLRPLNGENVALYSDDTQLARAVAEGLIRSGRIGTLNDAAQEIGREFVVWSKSPENNRAPGGACMTGCRRLDEGRLPWWECGGANNNSGAGGCGSVMRSHPYGLFWFDNREAAVKYASEHSRLTHGAPLAMAASAALAAGVWAALRNYDLPRIASFMQDAAYKYDQNTGDMLVQAEAMASDKFCETADVLDMWRSWAGHEAIATGLFCFYRYVEEGGHELVVQKAANSPGDSDSIAAIAGALAGALVGLKGLRKDWVMAVEKSEELKDLSFRLQRAASASSKLYLLERDQDYVAPFPEDSRA